MPGHQRFGGNGHAALFAQLHKGHALVLAGLREGIFQRRSAVAQGIPAHLLGAVQMPQCHIVELVEQGGIHPVDAAHAGLLALAGGSSCHELVCHQHTAAGRVRRTVIQHAGKGIIVALNGRVRPDVPHHGGLQKGQ